MGTYGLYHEAATINRDAAALNRDAALVRAGTRGGRATFGPPLQHRPYQARNSQSRKSVEMGFSLPQEGESPHKKWATARVAHSIATFPENYRFTTRMARMPTGVVSWTV